MGQFVRIGKNFSFISSSEWSETGRCFIIIAFQLCFRTFHRKGTRKSGKNGIEWNTIHLVNADVNILVKHTYHEEKDTEVLLAASRDVGLKVDTESKVYGRIPSPKYTRQCHDMLIANKSFESVAEVDVF
jgi:hypothetical protein